ncbi:protein fem-1 homolog A-like [Daphnia pulex]|uniref:protein fem-1 homolog A-like n=1 Tax=Daphnia pulex TaxID=6669 RepID=UPI001EDF4BF4|nr:protein fem-1 homolog A-like [Daphnia pulex]
MVESNVLDLVSQAVSRGSIAELNQLRKNYNWIAIPIHYVTQSLGQETETALQLSVRNGHYDVVEFLVGELKYQIYPEWLKSIDTAVPSNFNWTSLNFNKILPPLVVQSPEMEVIRDIANQIPIIKVLEYLIDPASDEPCQWLEFVLNSIMASSASRTDKIMAFELMGVTFVFKPRNGVWRGVQCWEQAMALRYSTVGDQSAIPIIPDLAASSLFVDRKKLIASPMSLQKFKGEWRLRYNLLDAHTQALAVSQRIVNQCGQTGPHSFHLEHLMRYAYRCYIHENQLNCSMNIALMILRQTEEFHSNSSPNCIRIFVETLDLLVHCLKHNKTSEELSFANLLVVVKFGLAILVNVMLLSPVVRATIDRWQFSILDKIHRLITEHLGHCRNNPAEIQQLKDCLSPYFRANNLKRFTSLLHLAISSKGTTDGRQILPITQLFLEAGADPTGIDTNGKTPLHLLSENQDWFQSDPESYEQVFQTLLDAGCFLDQSIRVDKTFLSLLNDQKSKCVSKFRFHHYLDPLVNVVLPLACICAKVIRRNRISLEGRLPPQLQSFVSRHSAMDGRLRNI